MWTSDSEWYVQVMHLKLNQILIALEDHFEMCPYAMLIIRANILLQSKCAS